MTQRAQRDFTARLDGLRAHVERREAPPQPPPPQPSAGDAPEAVPSPPRRGRPRADTVSVNLRMPEALLTAYVRRAAERSIATGRTVTAQAVMLEALRVGLGAADG
jgi:hypothetical protein